MAKTASGKQQERPGGRPAAKPSGKSGKAAAGGSKKMKLREVPKVAPISLGNALPQYPIICSECYEDFAYFPAREAEHIECPVCAHMGALPDEQILGKMTQFLKLQRQKHVLASILGSATFLLALIWILSISTDSTDPIDPGSMPLVLGGLAGVLLVLTIILAWGSEKNRWDFYF